MKKVISLSFISLILCLQLCFYLVYFSMLFSFTLYFFCIIFGNNVVFIFLNKFSQRLDIQKKYKAQTDIILESIHIF